MAFSAEHATIFRRALARVAGISEKQMFGGLCFLLNGNMLCGVHQTGCMARVGKDQESIALNIDGVQPLSFTGRKMGGMVDISFAAIEDRASRAAILKLAKDYVSALPAK
jgi:TfoX/Sxy family transcriptional regulator of competence genes